MRTLGQARDGRNIEFTFNQLFNQMQRQRFVTGIASGLDVFKAPHLCRAIPKFRRLEIAFGMGAVGVANVLAVVDANRRHVGVLEQLVLIVANDHQHIQLRCGNGLLQMRQRRLYLGIALGDTRRGNLLGGMGRHLRQQLCIGAGAAFAIKKRHAQIALAKIVLPIVERGGEHDAVRGAKGGSDTSHER